VNRLVALCLPGGPSFVDAVQRVWDEGDAVLPVDQRLPKQSQSDLFEHMGVSAIVDSSGVTPITGRPVDAGDALVVATSGSTGVPKGVVLTHDALAANAHATNSYIGAEHNVDKWLACLPLSHVGGFSVIVRALHSDGRPLDEVELRINQDEIQLRCPMLFRCYRDGADPKTNDGWFPTGDAGSLDSDGLLTVHGRKGDMIITGGENVWPVAVERILEKVPGVAECAIVGRPDAEWGQVVTAVVVPSAEPPTMEEIREHVKASLPGYCAPRDLELTDRLPRTALGKLQRHLL
jgi:O-succinylbenzoic acid--CoA ligase